MTFFTDLIAALVRGVFKLALLVAALVFIASVLVAGVVVALLTALWSLLTGRKPAVVTHFMRFRQASQQFRPGGWSGQGGRAPAMSADVVDVQAHEVPDTRIGTQPSGQPPENRA